MYLSDLVLLVVVVVYFARKIYQKHKSKALSDNKLDEKSFTALENAVNTGMPCIGNIDIYRYVIDAADDYKLEEMELFVNKHLKKYIEQCIDPEIKYYFVDNVLYMFVRY